MTYVYCYCSVVNITTVVIVQELDGDLQIFVELLTHVKYVPLT